jgi:hypothetical protein
MLEQRHLDHLRGSAISPEIIAARGYHTIAPGSVYDWRQLAGQTHSDDLLKKVLHQGALAIPLYRCSAEQPFTWVLRPDLPRQSREGKAIKYEYPKSTPNILDILPRYRAALGNPQIDIWLTEGAKKADALASAYDGLIVPVNENGVWGWRTKGKILDDFKSIVWEGRRVVLAPDGDVRHNKAVYQAVQRSARLFTAWGAAEVQILLLPCEKHGPKIGVDDYLAQGHTIDELESHLVDLVTVGEQTRVSMMRHPSTGAHLYLPAGYDIHNKSIVIAGENGAKPLYSGVIAITSVGHNLHTREETVTVVFDRYNQLQEVAVPRVSLSSGVRCAEALSPVGASVHSMNSRELSRFLVEFIRENEEDLPRVNLVDRLGNVGDGLVLPAGTLGIEGETKFTGTAVQIGTDRDAYARVLREVAGWDGLTTFWAVLALALAGPVLNRARPDRNPVLLLSNASGSGKTTLMNFAIGAYGDPTVTPLRIQCGSGTTTPKGISQVLAQTNGVPVHLEDVHMLMQRHPLQFAGMIYDYANGQLRSFGTLDQKSGGGQRLGGAMLMTGEMTPELQFEGSQRRLMVVNARRWSPLGVEARSTAGAQRAELLNSAWQTGAGLFGHQVCDLIWSNWDSFNRDVALLQADSALGNLQAWRPLLATAAQVLRLALLPHGIALDWSLMLRQWAALYQEGQTDRDPAQLAFDKVLVMLSQCELVDNREVSEDRQYTSAATWQWLQYERKMVAARRVGDSVWRVLTTSPQWKAVVGEGAVDMHGDAWLSTGQIQAHRGARRVSDRVHTGPGKGNLQCILVPDSLLAVENDS